MKIPPPADDNERTMMPEGPLAGVPASDAPAAAPPGQNALPIGTRLGEFEITGLVGEGGFGIVYLGYDHSLQRTVAIKEYMPAALAARTDTTVAVKSSRHADTFKAGLKSFINEARLLAQFDHPALLKVYRFWEANGTAYMVMPFYEGSTLKLALAELGTAPDEKWLKGLLGPLLEALEVLHQAQCFHRDIAPDNILLLKDNRPLLLDFGAARRVIGDMNQALTVIVKAGYAPLEQYAENPSLRQGPWTDLYALASVIYFAIMGQPPVPALSRMRIDPLEPLAQSAAGRYSDGFLRALDAALAVEPESRPQSVAEFRQMLELSGGGGTSRSEAYDAREGLPIQGADRIIGGGRGSRWVVWAAAGAVAVVVSIALLAWRPWESKTPVMATAPPTATVPATTTPPASAPPAGAPQVPERPAPSPDTPNPNVPAGGYSPPKAPIAPPRRFDPVTALTDVYNGRDPAFAVSVTVDKPSVRIKKRDPLRFEVTSARDGYVYVLVVGSTKTDFLLIFPNTADQENHIAANTPISLPREKWSMHAEGPAGTDRFVVIVSERPRDFTATGTQKVDGFRRFPLDQAARLQQTYTGAIPLFAGKAVCASSATTGCVETYGAAEFSIVEIVE